MKTATAILSIFTLTSVVRYGLVLILISIGLLKFTKHEADAIRPLAENSPFFSWTFTFLSTRMFSNATGIIEITLGTLIALRPLSPNLSALGSVGSVITFLIILSFIVSSPMHTDKGLSIPFIPFSLGHFFVLHFALLGASVWTAYEALTVATK
ncbi:MAG: DUF417 family protein [Acinetobacter sp.]|nr:hypothetical protein [Elizabethkingia anophelis]MDV4086337.1 hypothetical protein [Elizabethkingia anophelis]TXJ02002.1 MAG: DUF417 family protein [Acinetobacter sp.]